MIINYRCPKCDEPEEIEYFGGYPAKTHGLPENGYPAENAEIDPDHCIECGYKYELHLIEKKVLDKLDAYDPTPDED